MRRLSILASVLFLGALALQVNRAPIASAAPTSWSGKTEDTLNASQRLVVGKGKGTFDTLGHVKDVSKGGFTGTQGAPTQTEFSKLTMKTSSGDKIVFKLTGTMTDTTSNHSGSHYSFKFTWNISRGTGQYAGITGHGTITGYSVVNQSTAIGVEYRTWQGTVNWPSGTTSSGA